MAYAQSTIEEIIDSERVMALDGAARYGRYFKHARNVERDRSDTFGRLLSLMKKQQMLAFLSALRLHRVQAMMNLRQVLDAGAAAAYAIANPKVEDFVDIDACGIMDPSQELTKKRYRWLAENHLVKSNWIKDKKDQINVQTAHANILSGDGTFRVIDGGKTASTPFFDIEDEDFVKIDLWLISSIAITLMDLFYGVADSVARLGRSVVEFRPDFQQTVQGMAIESDALRDELKGSDRYKAAMQKIEQRAKGRAGGKPGARGAGLSSLFENSLVVPSGPPDATTQSQSPDSADPFGPPDAVNSLDDYCDGLD